ncbi:hypothetical protein ACFQ61_08410 [Streptomyces sp. NPDC056500]|uniref:hypothetical protein n=1 Tax=Streptomyces sp. NPDC056500 TaxID=3345840 RepID=UPI0036CCB346
MSSVVPPRKPIDVYPGTHRPLGVAHPIRGHPGSERVHWDEGPIYKKIGGYYREFFAISHLAKSLGRAPKTIYKWETSGVFPKATWIYNSDSRNGRRRLYTRRQIEGVVRIAHEEGVLSGSQRFISQTKFPERCRELFAATRATLPDPVQDWS